ncbi:MAG: S1/P1 nuclease [Proteobacteria bacterium]|nr:S1/P1 nuclease [Pseudomonadota bacterium]
MTRVRVVSSVCALLVGIGVASQASAWGQEGHRLIGALAYRHLSPAARAEVDSIIVAGQQAREASGETACPIHSLEDAAEFPDCVKIPNNHLVGKYQFMRNWHYDNMSKCGAPLPPAVYCDQGACATEAIKRAYSAMRDTSAAPEARLLALAQLAHFLGDIHQPLHMGDQGDKGGNDVPVTYDSGVLPGVRHSKELHAVWDNDLVAAAVSPDLASAEATVDASVGQAIADPQDVNSVDAWAAESFALTAHAYGDIGYTPACTPGASYVVRASYISQESPIVAKQLQSGVVRLAGVLNAAAQGTPGPQLGPIPLPQEPVPAPPRPKPTPRHTLHHCKATATHHCRRHTSHPRTKHRP